MYILIAICLLFLLKVSIKARTFHSLQYKSDAELIISTARKFLQAERDWKPGAPESEIT
jgi:hypothetical protein